MRKEESSLFASLLSNTTLSQIQETAVKNSSALQQLIADTTKSNPVTQPSTTQQAVSHDTRWEHCLKILVEDFLLRQEELLRLNRGRKEKIEEHIKKIHSLDPKINLSQILAARIGSKEYEAKLTFSHELAIFHLFQILLVKRWIDQGHISSAILHSVTNGLNWHITTYLKELSPQKILVRNQWQFLKQNIYSWFIPSQNAWERIRLHLQHVNLAHLSASFLSNLSANMSCTNRLAMLGFRYNPLLSKMAWQLLLEQKKLDEAADSITALNIGNKSGEPTYIYGVLNGDAIYTLQELSGHPHLAKVHAFAVCDLELFLSEIYSLWSSLKKIPELNLYSHDALSKPKEEQTTLNIFPMEKQSCIEHAKLALCLPPSHPNLHHTEIENVQHILNALEEHGKVLLASDHMWITDTDKSAQQLRELVLKRAVLRLVVDVRQLVPAGEALRLPQAFYLLEKVSSREVRDDYRARIFKIKGSILNEQSLSELWQTIITSLKTDLCHGEINEIHLETNHNTTLRIETMMAAIAQGNLASSPWTALFDPAFYEISNSLKRHPIKLSIVGSMFKKDYDQTQASNNLPLIQRFPLQRMVHIVEIPGKALLASESEIALPVTTEKVKQYCFIPDQSTPESINYFVAIINSSLIQFWYQLEWEQDEKFKRSQRRHHEQLLKLLPAVQIFPAGTIPQKNKNPVFVLNSLTETHARVNNLLAKQDRDIAEATELHQIIINLEETLKHSIRIIKEYLHHLSPTVLIDRWNIPTEFPEISAEDALATLSHLKHAALLHHPAFQILWLRSGSDCIVTDCKIAASHENNLELQLYSGNEPKIKIISNQLLIEALSQKLAKRKNRPWSELAQKIQFPYDIVQMQSQLNEFIKISKHQLNFTQDTYHLLNFIFFRLFGFDVDDPHSGHAKTIARYLSPPNAKVVVNLNTKL